MKKLFTFSFVVMFFATSMTYGQHQYRPLPIYRYLNLTVDAQNVMDSSASVLPLDTVSIPYPNCPALTWGGWDTASPVGSYNWVMVYYATGSFYEYKANGYNSTQGNMNTEQWYISPFFSTTLYTNVTLNFSSKCAKYAGPNMVAKVSTNWRSGFPSTGTWTTLPATIPTPNGTSSSPWTHSGNLSLDSYQGDSICVAFVYTSNTNAAATYYLDSIKIIGNPLSVHELNAASSQVFVSPNPVKSLVTFSDNVDMINNIEIYDMVGNLVSASGNVNKNVCSLNVAKLQQGIYVAKIQLKNGVVVSKKVIKQL
jgi:hypothetical protein